MIAVTVTTSDAEPTEPPHRISHVPGYEQFEVTAAAGERLRGMRMIWRSEDRRAKPMVRHGLVCGIDRCGPTARSADLPPDFVFHEVVDYDEVVAPDGSYTLSFHAISDQGWV